MRLEHGIKWDKNDPTKNVRLIGIKPEISFIIPFLMEVFKSKNLALVITSGIEGKHSVRNSDHYKGYAIDVRSYYWILSREQQINLGELIKQAIGPDYLVIVEKTHIHISWRPGVQIA